MQDAHNQKQSLKFKIKWEYDYKKALRPLLVELGSPNAIGIGKRFLISIMGIDY